MICLLIKHKYIYLSLLPHFLDYNSSVFASLEALKSLHRGVFPSLKQRYDSYLHIDFCICSKGLKPVHSPSYSVSSTYAHKPPPEILGPPPSKLRRRPSAPRCLLVFSASRCRELGANKSGEFKIDGDRKIVAEVAEVAEQDRALYYALG